MTDLYLDANAHLPLNKKALQAYIEFNQEIGGHGHPSSLSLPGRKAAAKLEECRAQIANLIGATKPEQIIFTSTCTQAAEWGLQLLHKLPNHLSPVNISKLEHSAVNEAARQIFNDDGDDYSVDELKNDTSGLVQIPNIKMNKTVCVYLQNEIGTVQPLKELKSLSSYLFSDLSQGLGKLPINVQELNVDFGIFSAHKFGGPGGVGMLYLKNTSHWKPFGLGGRYFMDRPGTPDVAAIVATTVALQESLRTLPERTEKMLEFREYIEQELDRRGIEIVGQKVSRCPNTTFIYLPNQAAQVLLELGNIGIHLGLGSACGSMHAGPSLTMKALGREGSTQDYLRISQYGEYGLEEAKYFIKSLDKILKVT